MENNVFIQGSKEWLEMRKSHIGSSDIAAILNISPYKTAYVLWQEKIGMKEEKEPTSAMIMGKEKEEEARNAYIKITGNYVIPYVCYFEDWQIAVSSLDGMTEDGKIICEIKCLGEKGFQDCLENGIPKHYFAQVQWQLLCSTAKVCHFFIYLNEDTNHMIEVKSDKEYQEGLLLAAKKFWDYVENGLCPPITEKDYLINEDEEANNLAKKWKEKREMKKALEEEMKEIQDKLLDFTDDGNTIFKDAEVRICRISKKGVIDWKKVSNKFDITQDELDACRKDPSNYPVFSVINNNKKLSLSF